METFTVFAAPEGPLSMWCTLLTHAGVREMNRMVSMVNAADFRGVHDSLVGASEVSAQL